MLPKGPLGNKQLKNLKIYTGQNNIINKKINQLDIISLNSKNSKTRKN
jgi:ribosomal protein L13